MDRQRQESEAAKASLRARGHAVYPAEREAGPFTTWLVSGFTREFTTAQLIELAAAVPA